MPCSIMSEERWTLIDEDLSPVYYCRRCLSLCVVDTGFGDCCGDCGGADIGRVSMWEYDRLHRQMYGRGVFFGDDVTYRPVRKKWR